MRGFRVCHVERSETSLAVTLTLPTGLILRFFSRDCGVRITMPVIAQRFNRSSLSAPLPHLLRERALRAIGIVLHTKIFIDLEQTLLVRDGF